MKMTPQIAAVFQSSNNAAEASGAQIIYASTGGLLIKVGANDLSTTRHNDEQTVDPEDDLQDLYCSMMTSKRGGIFDVTVDQRDRVAGFIRARRPILTELKTIIVSTSPDSASQEFARETLDILRAAGIAPVDIRAFFLGCPENSAIEDTYPIFLEGAREAQIVVSPEARLAPSLAFGKMLHHRVPIAAVVNRAVNFETELVTARLGGAPEKVVHALAHKVIAQRELLEATGQFKRVVEALHLTGISEEEWRAESASPANRKRVKSSMVD
jgi:hypothetical protein